VVGCAAVAALLLVGIDGTRSAAARGDASTPVASKTCPLTFPNGKKPPRAAAAQLPPVPPVFHGNGKLWVKLWPFGVIVARPSVIDRDGSIGIKLPWWRGVSGKLTITGTRLDAPAPPAKADIPSGYGPSGFQPSGVVFPTQGCWKVTGRVGKARLVFVTLVVKAAGNGY
jgi:hypothetical protein